VAAPDATLSFGELERLSNQLARRLRALHVVAETPVGLCLPRSAALVVGALGVLKAGGAYVALDPNHPTDRLCGMLRDSGAAAVVCSPIVERRLSDGAGHRIALDSSWVGLDYLSSEPLAPGGSGDLAYIIYTSGSTGAPRGVMLEHGGLLNLTRWHQRAFGITELDRTTQIANPGFDASVWELWPSLTAGASLHMPADDLRTDPVALRNWLIAQRITVSFLPTLLAEVMIELEWPARTPLRYMLTGGDRLRRGPGAHLPFTLVNNYGPTEATVVATSGAVPHGSDLMELPTIGRAIDNVELHVVDDQLRPVATGETGELLIGGAGVGRGYVNQPELTEERFVPDPFSTDPRARLYRSGDRVRVLPSGEIEFIGRVDGQVSIYGRRVELGEIETALVGHRDVQSTVVVAEEYVPGGWRLIAFVVPVEGRQLTPQALRVSLAETLPDYNIPVRYVWLDKLPIASTGKVDRSALLATMPSSVERPGLLGKPRNPAEQALASLVAELLGLDEVGVHENFFMLGGHSLLGAQLIARIDDRYGIEMPLRTLFDHPSVAEIAQEVERLLTADLEAMSEEAAERLAGELMGG
jgi:amino acid adenylation domain-containing protein